MILTLVCLLATSQSANLPEIQGSPAARFEKLFQSAQTLRVDLEAHLSTNPNVGKGSFLLKKPDRLRFDMKIAPSDYTFSINQDDIVSIERGNKIYREYGSVGRFFLPENDISTTPEYLLPLPLMAGSVMAILPRGVELKSEGKGTVNGSSVDISKASFTTDAGAVSVVLKIDSAGRLLELERTIGDLEGQLKVRLVFKNYRINESMPDSEFEAKLPAGFTAQTLPGENAPVNVGEKLPLTGWQPVSGSDDLAALARGKVLFVAIGDPACEVSTRAARTIGLLADQVRAKGGVAAALTLSRSAPATPVFRTMPNFYDGTGALSRSIRAPGTPLFYLVSPRGNITRLWYGFDNARSDAFVKDVLDWVDPAKG